jgi:hypothetical protein
MAKTMVMAIGDNGRHEPTAEDEVASIPVLVLAPGNKAIPQTIRALPHAFGRPVKLLSVRAAGNPWPLVTWRDDRGAKSSCYVRTRSEATDTLFSSLPASSRARILRAVEAPGAQG